MAFVDDLQEPGPLNSSPEIDSSVFPDGTNVEFVVVQQPGEHVSMRPRTGWGDTSCGTDMRGGRPAFSRADVHGPASIRVDVPGGTVQVRRTTEGTLVLTGPAELVAHGHLSPQLSEMFHG